MENENIAIVKDTYDIIAEYFAPMLDVNNSSETEVLFVDSFLERIQKGCNIVDLGCGVGKHGRYCASKGFCVTGYDISEKMIRKAESYNEQYPSMQFLHIADMCTFESTIKFDAAVAMYSLIHLTRIQAFHTLQNLVKYLKPNARILLTVYHGDRNGYYDEFLYPGKKQFYCDYTKNDLIELVESTGFEIEAINFWNDEDEITASNDDLEFGVIGLIGVLRGGKNE